jgi:hypothetical protein
MELNQDFKEFIELLNVNEVKYLVVGGYAVGFHGHPRYTGDIDFWVAISRENAEKIIVVLRDFGMGVLALQAEDFMKEDMIIQIGYEPNRIDILTSVTGISFEDCYSQKVRAEFDEITVDFIDIRNLKINKAASGRGKDLGDLENLPK